MLNISVDMYASNHLKELLVVYNDQLSIQLSVIEVDGKASLFFI